VIPGIGTDGRYKVLIAAIRRRGVETVVDRSWVFVFARLKDTLPCGHRGDSAGCTLRKQSE